MKLTTLLLTFLLGATVAFAQATPKPPALPKVGEKFHGNFEGTVKGGDERVSLEVNKTGGGRLQKGQKTYEVTEALFGEETLTLAFGKEANLLVKFDGEKLVGDLTIGTEKSSIELKRASESAASASTSATPAAASTDLSGQWEAVADANGQPFPFFLTLKIEGEKVTGGSSSQLGEAPITEGSWKDGKLMFSLENQNGVISMSATVIEGKLSGEFDYAGQLQGRWVAVKKN